MPPVQGHSGKVSSSLVVDEFMKPKVKDISNKNNVLLLL